MGEKYGLKERLVVRSILFKWSVKRLVTERIPLWIAFKLPRIVLFWAVVRAASYDNLTGNPVEATALDMMDRIQPGVLGPRRDKSTATTPTGAK